VGGGAGFFNSHHNTGIQWIFHVIQQTAFFHVMIKGFRDVTVSKGAGSAGYQNGNFIQHLFFSWTDAIPSFFVCAMNDGLAKNGKWKRYVRVFRVGEFCSGARKRHATAMSLHNRQVHMRFYHAIQKRQQAPQDR
jgi:hypothetical protein